MNVPFPYIKKYNYKNKYNIKISIRIHNKKSGTKNKSPNIVLIDIIRIILISFYKNHAFILFKLHNFHLKCTCNILQDLSCQLKYRKTNKKTEIRNNILKQSILFHPKNNVSDLHTQKYVHGKKKCCWQNLLAINIKTRVLLVLS